MKNLIFLSSLIFLITACSKKDENIKTDNKHHQKNLLFEKKELFAFYLKSLQYQVVFFHFPELVKRRGLFYHLHKLLVQDFCYFDSRLFCEYFFSIEALVS